MYSPQFRFALLISLFVIFGSIGQVLYSYSFGKNGLNLDVYLNGVIHVGATVIGGFFFIWVCSKFITFNGLKTTGFEGVFRDEYGTNFVFKHPISLTKFLPELIAKPLGFKLSDLENDLFAFLAGYKNMPYDIFDPKSVSLYDYATGMWHESRKVKNSTSFHHIVALSKYIGLVYVYKTKRKSAPLWQFWAKDKISHSKRCLFHGGLSSFILSTMPSFNKLDEKAKRALLVAVRYADNPIFIPTNCDELTYSLYECSHKAEQRVKKRLNIGSSAEIDPSENDIIQFNHQVNDYFQTSIEELNLNPQTPTNQSDGIYLGMGLAIVRVSSLIRTSSKNLSPDIRSAMDLWETSLKPHKSWKYLIDTLEKQNLLHDKLDEQKVSKPINTFIIDNYALTNAILIKVEQKTSPRLRAFLDNLPEFKRTVVVEKDKTEIKKEITLKSNKIDELIKKLYS